MRVMVGVEGMVGVSVGCVVGSTVVGCSVGD